LAGAARRGLTIEIDAGLVRAHRAEDSFSAEVELRHADARKVDLSSMIEELGPPVRVVANLPYSASSPLLRRLLDLREELEEWSVMLQRELALRLLASPRTRDYGSLTVLHQLLVRVDHCADLPPQAFFPEPKVVSSFLRICPLETPLIADRELLWVERVLRAAFSQRRKTLSNALRALLAEENGSVELLAGILAELRFDPRVRAEALEPQELLALARRLGELLPNTQTRA